NAGGKLTTIFVAAVPIDVYRAFTAGFVFVDFLAPTVVYAELNLVYEACALGAVVGIQRSARSAFLSGTFDRSVIVRTEKIITLVAIRREDVREFVIRAIVDANGIAQRAHISRTVYRGNAIASRIGGEILVFKEQVAYTRGMQHKLTAHCGRNIDVIRIDIILALTTNRALPFDAVGKHSLATSAGVVVAIRRIDRYRQSNLAGRYCITGLSADNLRVVLQGLVDLGIAVRTARQHAIAIYLIVLQSLVDVNESVSRYVDVANKFKVLRILSRATPVHQVHRIFGRNIRPRNRRRPGHINALEFRPSFCTH